MDYKIAKILTAVLFALSISACKHNYSDIDCTTYDYSTCTTIEPEQAVLKIKVTLNAENTTVPITIYKGNIEDSVAVFFDTVKTSEYIISLPVNEYYSAKARYTLNNHQIIAVDGDKIEKTGTDVCDSTCWSVNEGKINLELKK
jgi:hypothetical protein